MARVGCNINLLRIYASFSASFSASVLINKSHSNRYFHCFEVEAYSLYQNDKVLRVYENGLYVSDVIVYNNHLLSIGGSLRISLRANVYEVYKNGKCLISFTYNGRWMVDGRWIDSYHNICIRIPISDINNKWTTIHEITQYVIANGLVSEI